MDVKTTFRNLVRDQSVSICMLHYPIIFLSPDPTNIESHISFDKKLVFTLQNGYHFFLNLNSVRYSMLAKVKKKAPTSLGQRENRPCIFKNQSYSQDM